MNPFAKRMLEAGDHYQAGRYDKAEPILQGLLSLEPDHPTVLLLAAELFQRRGWSGSAVALLEKALSRAPDYAAAWLNLGCAHRVEHRRDLAKECWMKAIEHGGETADVLINMSSLYADSGEPDEALKWIGRALELEPDNAQARWQYSLALLTQGRWAEGWAEHEARLSSPNYRPRKIAPLWDGRSHVPLLCVTGEQGLGDEIMFLSCLPDVLPFADEVVVECQPRLVPLVERSFGVKAYPDAETVKAARPDITHQVALGSLPYLFRRDAAAFPGTPYLKADPARVEHYRQRLAHLGPRPWIGLSWVGGSKQTRVAERSIAPYLFGDLLRNTCVSVQYDSGGIVEDAAVAGIPHWPEAAGRPGGGSYDETAALVSACDVIVSVCTAVVHLSGALGRPCWVVTPRKSSWRYGLQDRMAWYGSVRLYRQPADGDWNTPLARINADIRQLSGAQSVAA